MAFWVWFLSLSNNFLEARSLEGPAAGYAALRNPCKLAFHSCISISFLLNNIPSYGYTTMCLSIHQVDNLNYVHLLAIMNSPATHTGVQVLV